MNLTALQTRAASRYRDTLNRRITAVEWTEYLNDAYMDVVAAEPYWPFLVSRNTSLSVAAGTGEVALLPDASRVHAVYNATDKIPLAPIPGGAQFRRYFPDPANGQGIPLFYRLRGLTLEVYPWPAVTTEIDVDVSVPPPVLAAGGDEPVFPEQYHRILVVGALSKAYVDDGDREGSRAFEEQFERILGRLRRDLLDTQTESYPAVIDDF